MFNAKHIWIPEHCQTEEEALFFAVETYDGYSLSKEKYAALFFQKIYNMIEPDDDLLEDIPSYFPSITSVSIDDIEDYDIQRDYLTWLILEAEEFYFGFPPIDKNEIECFPLSDPPKEKIEELDIEELKYDIENEFTIYSVFSFVQDKMHSYLRRHSESSYDRDLSKKLMGIED
jgi:hypothetical protein